MTPEQEAAEILIRLFNTLAAGMGKRLKEEHKSEIRRACALLSQDGTLAPLDDLPRISPAEAAADNYRPAREVIPNYPEWKGRREERER